MMHKISLAVSAWLEQEGVISNQEKNIYSYAVYSIIFGMMPLFLSVFLGSLFGMMFEGILLIIPFMLIRKFSGGFHLGSVKKCIVFSGSILILSFCVIKYLAFADHVPLLKPLVWVSTCGLCIFSPIDSDARELKPKEIKLFGKLARIIATTLLITYLILDFLKISKMAIPIGVGILLASLLQLPCIATRVVHKVI